MAQIVTINLAQLKTFKDGHIFVIFCLLCADVPILQCFLNFNHNLQQKKAPQNDNFFIFCKTQVEKERFVATPSLDQNLVFFIFYFCFETKNIDVEQKHNLKSGKQNKDKHKGLERENKTGKPKQERTDEKNVIEHLHVVPFMKQNKEERKGQKNKSKEPKENKKERQKGKKKNNKRERERERERETEKEKLTKWEAQKRLRRNKGRHSKINKNALCKGEKTCFFQEKQRKERKNKRTKQTTPPQKKKKKKV